jgi:membrane associated rhomboid family serine protease
MGVPASTDEVSPLRQAGQGSTLMLIPLNTDAPIYHFPFACIAMVVVNCVAFLVTGWGLMENVSQWSPWALAYGDGLHPVQWITSNFIHMGPAHLIGNMVFLWGFGLVVEGKLGWWKFLLVYLAIGISECAVEQTIMLGHSPEAAATQLAEELIDIDDVFDEDAVAELKAAGLSEEEIDAKKEEFREELQTFATEIEMSYAQFNGSCGASSIIYGMLAMSLVWAPKNEVTLLLFIGFRAVTFEATIMSFSAWYIGLEILIATFEGFAIATSTLHLMGAAAGFGIGTLMLKKDLVDCEDWDLFSVLSGNYGSRARDRYGNRIEREPRKGNAAGASSESETGRKREPKKKSLRSAAGAKKKLTEVERFVEAQEFDTAYDELYNARLRDPEAMLDEPVLKSLAIGLAKSRQWNEAVKLMQEYIDSFPETANPIRLRLANVFLKAFEDGKSALRILKEVDQKTLSEDALASFRKLVNAAKQRK